MPASIVFATNNEHKLQEMRDILGSSYSVLSLSDIGCHDDIPETAPTLEGNALQKARWVADRYGCDCFADDTGLEVEMCIRDRVWRVQLPVASWALAPAAQRMSERSMAIFLIIVVLTKSYAVTCSDIIFFLLSSGVGLPVSSLNRLLRARVGAPWRRCGGAR